MLASFDMIVYVLTILPATGTACLALKTFRRSFSAALSPAPALPELLKAWEVARKLVQMVLLERLMRGDLRTGGLLLRAVAHTFNPNAVPEYAAFGASLVSRLGVLLKAGKVRAGARWRPGNKSNLSRLGLFLV